MKKVLTFIAGGYLVACIGLVAWMFGRPKSYGKFISKWQEKVMEGMEEED